MISQPNPRSRSKFYLVISIFLLPMLISWILYFFHEHIHFKKLNHGKFISPPIHADFLHAKSSPNTPKVWHLVHIDSGNCDTTCQKITYQLNQVRKVLGKDQDRLNILSLHAHTAEVTQLQQLFQQKNLTLTVDNKIYLIDPLDNLFMYYADTAKPMDILKDLKRVLEVSQIG